MIDPAKLDLAAIQSRILGGEVLSVEEYRAVIEKYRGERRSAATSTGKGKKAPVPSFDLDSDLDSVFGKRA
jgi:hypothetical protein